MFALYDYKKNVEISTKDKKEILEVIKKTKS